MTRQPRALTGFKLVSGRCGQGKSAPADALLAADAGAFTALGGQDIGVAGVGVAPAQAGLQGPGLDGCGSSGGTWPGGTAVRGRSELRSGLPRRRSSG